MKKVLIIRFSSIGDIILTTPILRALKMQLNIEIHFITKEQFKEILTFNPHITKIHTFKKETNEILNELKKENFDLIIDLHKNLRSFSLINKLGVKSVNYNKLNFIKFVTVLLKDKKLLPKLHIVDRYFFALKPLGVINDGKGLEYFINEKIINNPEINKLNQTKYVAIVLGGSYYTKQIPIEKLKEICKKIPSQLILLGSKNETEIGNQLVSNFKNVVNLCGKLSFNESAFVVKEAEWVITSDTGLMHVAAAYNKKIISVWGNTIPEFGMSPYIPNDKNILLQVNDLNCRPCSKLGYKKCPKKHFNCMQKINFSELDKVNWPHFQ
jgi:ADP-heptose:LPS heptosyltransferase